MLEVNDWRHGVESDAIKNLFGEKVEIRTRDSMVAWLNNKRLYVKKLLYNHVNNSNFRRSISLPIFMVLLLHFYIVMSNY